MLREPREDPFGKSDIDDENTVDNNGTTATRANECIESQRPIGDENVANNYGAENQPETEHNTLSSCLGGVFRLSSLFEFVAGTHNAQSVVLGDLASRNGFFWS